MIDCKNLATSHSHVSKELTLFLALQLADKYRVTTPVNWKQGEDVIVHASVTQDEANQLFPEHTVHLVSISQSGRRVAHS